jgi:hypothetical protein
MPQLDISTFFMQMVPVIAGLVLLFGSSKRGGWLIFQRSSALPIYTLLYTLWSRIIGGEGQRANVQVESFCDHFCILLKCNSSSFYYGVHGYSKE